ncbi:LOW QUALITY PROTEIN: uncharacterized protein LOC132558757 [Ylistrum balloti]|uniref:LOW QUALITY PROTEIN: uncharacterized protein LOC132558757 n=1 Tax=Ylistrum balloti TaxID=509963 RepID=UPI0029059B9E|nr:LOW QUALITY PROTEIN: uncharacterized protein LOC132558757 [Ylistrum balloti]
MILPINIVNAELLISYYAYPWVDGRGVYTHGLYDLNPWILAWSEDRFVNRKKIAVIGAGVSGLCALKHLTENLEDFGRRCLRRCGQLFRSRRIQLMASWMSSDSYYGVVAGIGSSKTGADSTSPYNTNTSLLYTVLISSSNYSKCHIPNVKGIENFTGHVIHSRDYRTPEVYQRQRVLILGASFSGLDITFDLSKNAAQIYIGHRKDKMQIKLPANVSERPDASHLDVGIKVVFLDGSETEVDSIIFCTGYSYDFPFLADDTIQVKDERIKPLYKHLVHIKYHNLFFVGITRHVSYFMQAHEQAKAAVAILKGGIQLPSEQAMLEDAEREFQQKRQDYGMSHLHAHYLGMGDLEWKLNKDHAELCGFEPLPPVLKSIMEHVKESRSADFCNFRKKNYFFKDAQHFGVID